jgi:hypothetical protein
MAHQQIEVSLGQSVTLAMDDDVLVSRRLWALAYARLINDVTGEWVAAPVTILVAKRGVTPRYVSDGLIVLIGRPHNLFPNLALQGYTLDYAVYAVGYQPYLNLVAPIPALPAFPTTYNPVDLGEIHLQPV